MHSLIESKRRDLTELCRRLSVRRLELFGSAVRTDFDAQTSDLDFVVEFNDLPPAAYADAYFSLKEQLERLFNRPVDLLTAASIVNPYLRATVEAERQTVYAA
jgi:predicted nucleotidyltransferase